MRLDGRPDSRVQIPTDIEEAFIATVGRLR
jgi:hypothetical protein